jgi:3-phenylpropionate/trans-cinnamate dioxygenase ferredoxin reductase subunit
MTPFAVDHLIIGGGHAGASAAATLSGVPGSGKVLLVSAEPEYPYQRYLLSKQYLRGQRSRERLALRPAKTFEANSGAFRLGTSVLGLDADCKRVHLDTGEEIQFGKLLLATGASVRGLPVPGGDLPGVYYLRTLADAETLRQAMAPGRRVIIVGGGFIGAEVAASFTQQGLQVTVVDVAQTLWAHLFGEQLGRFFHEMLQKHGVQVLAPAHVEEFGGDGHVERVVLQGGDVLPCDFVVVGIGVRPETALAEQAGLPVDKGILVDEYLQTKMPDIFAAGDNARFYSPLFETSLRIEHWDVAGQQGQTAALNMLGRHEPFDKVPYFFSELFDVWLEFLGYAPHWDQLVLRRSEPEKFTALFIKDGWVHGALLVNNGDELNACRELIKRRVLLEDLRRLENQATSLVEYLT